MTGNKQCGTHRWAKDRKPNQKLFHLSASSLAPPHVKGWCLLFVHTEAGDGNWEVAAKTWRAGHPEHMPWEGENIFGIRSGQEGKI